MKTKTYPPIHPKPTASFSFDRLDALWERFPQYHEMKTFTTLDGLLEEHKSYQKDFSDLREEYEANHYEGFLIQLSLSDLPHRHATKMLVHSAGPFRRNSYVDTFMEQFSGFDTDHKAFFSSPKALFLNSLS